MSFDSGRLSHAYITDDHFAYNIAMAVVCGARDTVKPCKQCSHCDKASRSIHPDIIVIDEDKIKDIEKEAGKDKVNLIVSVNVVRWIKRDAYIVPNDSIQKAYIVKYADTMNVSAQNAFLKMLEEPPKHAVFLLCSENPAILLPTVRSRCVEITPKRNENSTEDAKKGSSDTDDDDSELLEFADEFVTAISVDNVKLMECMFRLDKFDRLSFADFLILARERVILSIRKYSGDDSQDLQKKLVKAESILGKAGEMLNLNVSVGHISGFICASLIEDKG